MTYTVLVLCTGNVGRSPLAEGLLRRRLAEEFGTSDRGLADAGVDVISAGTRAPIGVAPSRRGVALAAERGVDISEHRSKPVTEAMLQQADRVFCMDAGHARLLASEFGVDVELLDPAEEDIPDPREEDLEFFRKVRDDIERAIASRLPQLASEIRRLAGRSGGFPGSPF